MADNQAFAAAQTDFAVGLLREAAAKSNDSVIVSPVAVAFALSLPYAGAAGDTRREFERVFAKGGIPGDALDSLFQQTLTDLTTDKKETKYADDKDMDSSFFGRLGLANRVYAAHDLQMKAAYRQLIDEKFGGRFKQVDFGQPAKVAEEINAFVKMMKLGTTMPYVATDDVQVLELPFTDYDARSTFTIFLPKERFGLADWLQKVDGASLLELGGRLERKLVNVELPRFTITSEFGLKEVLEKLGFSQGFKLNADFSGIADERPLFISSGVQLATIEVGAYGEKDGRCFRYVVLFVLCKPPPSDQQLLGFAAFF
ncbi:hypothetical protein M3Y99_01758100 [Aphelenchoides fujianensis]|nr:hypothetical protein M3Y99_01758100 [Aphelenchoides fujianensis]